MAKNNNGTTYLGDGLYASHDGFMISVFAHNGVEVTNMVYFEDRVLENFEKWLKNLRERGVVPPAR